MAEGDVEQEISLSSRFFERRKNYDLPRNLQEYVLAITDGKHGFPSLEPLSVSLFCRWLFIIIEDASEMKRSQSTLPQPGGARLLSLLIV